MSRGGRGAGRGRGGRVKGPDVEWEDEPLAPQSTKPEPLFPEIDLPVPKSISEDELERVNDFLSFRDEVRNGPLYTVLEPSNFTDATGKLNPRAGFDPFTGNERYSSRFYKSKRTTPDFTGMKFNLKFFPRELWSTIDPQRKDPLWNTVTPTSSDSKTRKRKRPVSAVRSSEDEQQQDDDARLNVATVGPSSDLEEDSDSDGPLSSVRRPRPTGHAAKTQKKNHDPTVGQVGQKRGLEAEDDIPDVEQDDEDDQEADEPPQDSEFEEGSDDEADDYNAENYFDAGEGDDFEDGAGGGGGGGGGGDDVYD